ncbi:cytochrome P450 4A10 [Immersiella caudata]|uniref:Cytochrome P450 4A10 n=1 Tax=Immersiella caudata TaxID=314043 RepID=A0AA40C3Q8_9PEZI|nr:cytochrome P450 4A10 [Immersiella caudata]
MTDTSLLETIISYPWILSIVILFVISATLTIYRTFSHPLAPIPGPFLAKFSSAWLHYHTYKGDECSTIRRLHALYGPVIRIAPNEIDIADGKAIAEIYHTKASDILKAAHYRKFDVDGHATIFSTIESEHRLVRFKAVASLFATASINESRHVIKECASKFVSRLRADASCSREVDILNLARSFACDVTTACLFRDRYGALDETRVPVSAFVDSFVTIGRFFYLPSGFSVVMDWLSMVVFPDKMAKSSVQAVDSYLGRLVGYDVKKGGYPARLMEAGISVDEAKAQSKDLVFAGTYSTGMTIATLCWLLARNPEKYAILRRESLQHQSTGANVNSPPYLRATIKEGMRLSMASPTRLTRTVSGSGMNFRGHHLPAGTNVGLGAFQLHLNPDVFPDPEQFLPERWEQATPEMQRDWVPFGMGSRACIARGLATTSVFEAMQQIIAADVLNGAQPVKNKIEIKEWYNSKVIDGQISLTWPKEGKLI